MNRIIFVGPSIITICLVSMLSHSDIHIDNMMQAEQNAWKAQKTFQHCMDYVHGWLRHRDPKSGLIPRNLTRDWYWNAQDSAADNYPFMVLTCQMLDEELFRTTMHEMLQTEIRLTNRLDNLPDDFDFATQAFRKPAYDLRSLIFGGSEYVKDGLIPLIEWMGHSPWSGRMIGIIDSIWKHAPFETPYGLIPSDDFEINGEQLQVLCRLYWLSNDERYQAWAFRIADYYLLDHLPTDKDKLSLDDHGCEIISGLAGAYFLAYHTDPQRRDSYREPIHRMIDRLLEVAVNEDGLFYMVVNPKDGQVLNEELTDNWGYDYNAVLNVAMLENNQTYYDATERVLRNVINYVDYPWERGGADGMADSVEGGLNLLNRIPVDSGFEWVDKSMEILLAKQRYDGVIEGWHGDGNFTRTSLMYALWKTQGTTLHPWRADLAWGAVTQDDVLVLSIRGDWRWSGTVRFDRPRHKDFFRLPFDYPRINQFPEWFVVDGQVNYKVEIDNQPASSMSGAELLKGLKVEIQSGVPLHVTVQPVKR